MTIYLASHVNLSPPLTLTDGIGGEAGPLPGTRSLTLALPEMGSPTWTGS